MNSIIFLHYYCSYSSYLDSLIERRDEWAISFRTGALLRGHHTNNFCEATMCIIKDIVLNRWVSMFIIQTVLNLRWLRTNVFPIPIIILAILIYSNASPEQYLSTNLVLLAYLYSISFSGARHTTPHSGSSSWPKFLMATWSKGWWRLHLEGRN